MSGLCDLHTHTAASDGQHTPAELVRLAKDRGLSVLAVTDAGSRLGISRKTFTRRAEEWRQAAGLKRRKTT